MNNVKHVDLSENRTATVQGDGVRITEKGGRHTRNSDVQVKYIDLLKILHQGFYSLEDIRNGFDVLDEIEEKEEGGILSRFF